MHPLYRQPVFESGSQARLGGRLGLFAWWSVTLMAVILLNVFMVDAKASSGIRVVVPMTRTGAATFSTQSGLQIGVDTMWAGARGYRPLVVSATMAKPATADTLVTIKFHAGGWNNNHQVISVEYDFELSQGLASTTAQFVVPKYTDWNTCGWDIWVDGVKDEALCMPSVRYNAGSSGALAVGVLLHGLDKATIGNSLSSLISSPLEEVMLSSNDLPDRWVEYSSLDIIATSVQSLEFIQETAPEKLVALFRWIRGGGNLWVLELGQDFAQLPELTKVLQTDLGEIEESALKDWRFLRLDVNGRTQLRDRVQMTMEVSEQERSLTSAEILDSPSPTQAIDSRQWFVTRAYGLGTLVALQTSGSRTATTLQRSSLIKNLPWTRRLGNDPSGGNPDFNNLLIPDVGTAPVFEFQLLISLFVIGIGPVNYWLLKRRNQLPLLLVTVPAAALAATFVLFAYGFLADGIGVRVRARSLTVLDQQAGEMACWARLSYFAGIAPADGLRMPEETTLYPILPSRSESNSFNRRHADQQRVLEWDQQQRTQQHLTRGWLGSRTPTQYLAISARPTKKRLQFDADVENLAVTNHLGTQVMALVVQDHAGNIFASDQIDIESSKNLTPSTYVRAASKLRQLLTENLPQLPAGYVQPKRSRHVDYGMATSESLMELQLEAIVSPIAIGWGNGTFVAVTKTGIEMPLGLDDVTETSSLHVLRGTW